jgi:hypothetical protein
MKARRFVQLLAAPLVCLLLLCVLLCALLLAAALQGQAAVSSSSTDVSSRDVERAVQLVRLHDPRQAPPGQVRVVQLSAHDLEVLLNHAGHRWLGASSQVQLAPGSAQLTLSAQLLHWPLQPWLNLHVQLAQTNGLPDLTRVQLGRLPVPTGLAQWLALKLLQRAGLGIEWPMVRDVVQQLRFGPQHLSLAYAWRADSTQRVMNALVPLPEQQRLMAYAHKVAELSALMRAKGASSTGVSLSNLLGPVFALARQRSAAGGGGKELAAAENRAAIVVLSLFANGRDLGQLLPAAGQWPRPEPLRVLLSGRDDWPLHFLISAAMAAEATGSLSNAVGLYKEVRDSRVGSGFSFDDIAADRAGTRFGELAVHAPERLQAALAGGVIESDFMPMATDLPGAMAEPDFLRRFGGVGAPAYQQQMAEIERRVAALPVLR